MKETDCPQCEGRGSLAGQRCETCRGTGERPILHVSPTTRGAIVGVQHGSAAYALGLSEVEELVRRCLNRHPAVRLVTVEARTIGPALHDSLREMRERGEIRDVRVELVSP